MSTQWFVTVCCCLSSHWTWVQSVQLTVLHQRTCWGGVCVISAHQLLLYWTQQADPSGMNPHRVGCTTQQDKQCYSGGDCVGQILGHIVLETVDLSHHEAVWEKEPGSIKIHGGTLRENMCWNRCAHDAPDTDICVVLTLEEAKVGQKIGLPRPKMFSDRCTWATPPRNYNQ